MKIHILTIFPEIFQSFLNSSLIGKAINSGTIEVKTSNIRDFAEGPHRQVDDIPYGGGAGMVMKPEPLFHALEDLKKELPQAEVVLFSASGKKLTQRQVSDFSTKKELILICSRYEGVDQRVIDEHVTHEISIADFVLMGGEVPAMAFIEAVSRLVPGVIGNSKSLKEESFSLSDEEGLLVEGPHYTRPAEFRGMKVPDVLLGGDHKKINAWRLERSREKRRKMRPDLIGKGV